MDLTLLAPGTLTMFFLLMLRVVGMVVGAPLFSQRSVPVQLLAGLSVVLSMVLFPLYRPVGVPAITDMWQMAVLGGIEFLIGLLLGFLMSLVFAAVDMASTMVSQQMGLSMVQSFNPFFQSQSEGLGQLFFILAVTLFFTLNVHHTVLEGVAKSFEAVPVAQSHLIKLPILVGRLISLGSSAFVSAMLIAFPVFSILVVVEVALAYVSKVMPQMNIFIVSLPFKIWIGFFLLLGTMPFLVKILVHQMDTIIKVVYNIYRF